MIIQPILSMFLLGILLFVLVQHHSGRFLRPAILIVVAVGLILTWMPAQSVKLANFLGVGRGVDLIFYIWIVLSLLGMVSLYITISRQAMQITNLTRALALYQARTQEN